MKKMKYMHRNIILVSGVIIFSLNVFSCVDKNESTAVKSTTVKLNNECDLSSYLGTDITVVGIALHAKEGAIINGVYGMVIIDPVLEWPEDHYGKEVLVKGTLHSINWPMRESGTPGYGVTPVGRVYYIRRNMPVLTEF
jgi:hypothetical protein